jgi:hypothetical protein
MAILFFWLFSWWITGSVLKAFAIGILAVLMVAE